MVEGASARADRVQRSRAHPNHRWLFRSVSYSARSPAVVSRVDTSAGATSHHDPGAGQVGVRDDRHHDHHRARVAARLGQRIPQLGRGPGPQGPGAEAGRDLNQVEAEVVALQPRRLGHLPGGQLQRLGPVAELVAELPAAAQHLQPVNDLIAAVVRDDEGDGQALLGGGDQLGRRQQERPVAEEGDDPRARLGVGQPHADRGRDLVPHAGEAELQVAAAAAGGVPYLEQVAGRAAGRGDHHVAGPRVLLQDPDELALGRARRRCW